MGVEYPEMAGEGGIILQGMRWDGRMGRRSLSIVADRLVAGELEIFYHSQILHSRGKA